MQVNAILKNQNKFIQQFAQQLQGEEFNCLNASTVIFPEETGEGKISYFKNNYLSFIISNVLLKEELIYRSPTERVFKSKFIDFGIFLNGNIESNFLTQDKYYGIEVPKGDFKYICMNVPIDLIPKNITNHKELYTALRQFSALPTVHVSMNDLFSMECKGITETIAMESKGLEIVGKLFSFLQKKRNEPNQMNNFSDYDIACIELAKSILKESFINPPTIKMLSRQVGINEQKLKIGFKQLFSITMRQYVISLKMELARELLQKKDASISDISYQVGYNHRGYFAKTFKRFFNTAPHIYQMMHHSKV